MIDSMLFPSLTNAGIGKLSYLCALKKQEKKSNARFFPTLRDYVKSKHISHSVLFVSITCTPWTRYAMFFIHFRTLFMKEPISVSRTSRKVCRAALIKHVIRHQIQLLSDEIYRRSKLNRIKRRMKPTIAVYGDGSFGLLSELF